MRPWNERLAGFDAHHRLLVAVVAGGACAGSAAACGRLAWIMVMVIGWDAFAATMLALSWLRIFYEDARTSVLETKLQDSSRSAIFLLIMFAATAALGSVAFLPGTSKQAAMTERVGHIAAAGGTVVLAWLLIHTIYALHYAHLFYERPQGKNPEHGGGKGLEFPGDAHAGFLDFAYFSFVIGMTCQVSDVQITAPRLRRLALGHGMLSFAYNTVILALTINLSSSMALS